jgi:hypothetical protein
VKNPASIFFPVGGVPHFSFLILEPRLHISIVLQFLREAIATGNQLCPVLLASTFFGVFCCLCLSLSIGCESLQVEAGIIFELPD